MLQYAMKMSFKSVIYFIIIPVCADLVGIIYRSRDADWTLQYILDNLTAMRPFPMMLLHYGGLFFAMLYESVIAFTMAHTLSRRRQ